MTIEFPTPSGRAPQRAIMFQEWAARIGAGHGGTSAALKALADGYKSFHEQQERISADDTRTLGAKVVQAAKAARALLPLVERLDAASQEAGEQAARLEGQTRAAYVPDSPKFWDAMRHQEIRAHFKSLPSGDKLKLLETAKAEGDHDTLRAIAAPQSYLSGVAPQVQQIYRDHLIELHAAREAALLKGIREQQGHVRQFRWAMLQSVADSVDFRKADELIAAAREDIAAA